ncbi:MAG: DNA polymerase III subunit alpha [Planctomycetota bacterium]
MVLLLARSHWSLLTAPASVAALCEEAVLRGHDHLALVDANGLYGLWPFAQQTARLGLRGIFGCEVVHQGRRVFALAQDAAGYASLCELLSERHLRADFDLPRALARLADGLWFVCRDLDLLPQLAVRLPRERLLVALGPRGCEGPTAATTATSASRKAPDPEPLPPRGQLLAAARDLGLPLCAVHDVWFPRPEDRGAHVLFQAVKWNRSLRQRAAPAAGAAPRAGDGAPVLPGIASAPSWMHLPARGELHHGHADHPEAIAAAERLLAACSLTFPAQSAPIFPEYRVPDGRAPAHFLRELAIAGMAQRRFDPSTDPRQAQARLDHELQVIERMGFAPYFLVVREITELARARGIPFLGRGSAADSLVAYALGLTDADPIRYGLLFERFLNPARSDLPDIDLDFCWRRRDELLAAVYDHFGHDRVAMIATYNTCGPRAAYAEAAKAAGVPPTEAARRSKLLPWHARRELSLQDVVAGTPGFYRDGVLPPAAERDVVLAAECLLQAPRHLGVHPGGIVVTPGPVARHAPLERSQKGVVVTQYDKRFVEALGLVKIDLLGNRALSIVDDCERMLRDHGVRVPPAHEVPEDEPRTVALLQTGRTLGCFQVESPAMRTLLRQLRAPNMDRVIQAVALVRPGPAAAGMKDAFIARSRGLEPVTAAHPLLAEVFADTFGIMLYQEDVIRAAMAVAGLDGAAGDSLRRRLCARDGGGRGELEPFVVQGLRRGLPRAAIEQIWAEMARFSAYSFCKAHAVTYGRLAFRCVYLKAHWPVAFLCAMLNNDAGYFDKGVYVEEAKRLGATFTAPCVQRGDAAFALTAPDTVRTGLGEVHGLTRRTRDQIAAARRLGGPFRSFDDFLQRVRPQRDEAEHLIRVGACDAFGTARPELLWRLQVALTPRAQAQRARANAPGALLPDALQPASVPFPALPEYPAAERTQHELELLGYALGAHPVDVLWQQARFTQDGVVPCGRVDECAGRTVRIRGWLVAWRQHRTENGEPMAFATIEDGTGIVETTLFPRVFQQCGGVFQGRGPYLVRGVVEERLGGVGVRVQTAAPS